MWVIGHTRRILRLDEKGQAGAYFDGCGTEGEGLNCNLFGERDTLGIFWHIIARPLDCKDLLIVEMYVVPLDSAIYR